MSYDMMRRMATPVGTRLGAALRATYEDAGVSQDDLAAALGVDQTTISGWARGRRSSAPLDSLEQIERVCKVPKGTILRRAGYVAESVSVVSAIASDPHLDQRGKRLMATLYAELKRSASPAISREIDPSEAMKSTH